jgi:hypothetical protein
LQMCRFLWFNRAPVSGDPALGQGFVQGGDTVPGDLGAATAATPTKRAATRELAGKSFFLWPGFGSGRVPVFCLVLAVVTSVGSLAFRSEREKPTNEQGDRGKPRSPCESNAPLPGQAMAA